jgi:predicted CopG family antitoxin
MSNASKRIPVTEERWKELNELKGAGETYDELLAELIREHQRRQLAERVKEVREADSEELTSLDELSGPPRGGGPQVRRRTG